jgi:hypothetical protein
MKKHKRSTLAAPDWLLGLTGNPADRVSLQTFAEANGVHEQTARNWVRSGRLETVRMGGRIYVTRESAAKFLSPEVAAASA